MHHAKQICYITINAVHEASENLVTIVGNTTNYIYAKRLGCTR